MRRRPWPRNADEHRIAAISSAREIRKIADDLDAMKEYDRATIKLAIAHLQAHSADIQRWLTLAKFGEPEEQ
jgi:hypothetical protein